MPVQLYETLFLLDSGKFASDGEAIRNALHGALTKHGGEILVSRDWDDRKLAYAIRKDGVTHKKGAYYAIYYNLESTNQQELEVDFRLTMTDYLIRHMTSAVDPKYADVMMDIARNDQSKGFCLKGMQEEAAPMDASGLGDAGMLGDFGGGVDAMGGIPGDRGDRPRGPRGPRRDEKPE